MTFSLRPFLARILAACPVLAVPASLAALIPAISAGDIPALLAPVFLLSAGLWLLPVSLGVWRPARAGASDQYTLFPDFARRLAWRDMDTRRRLLDNALALQLPANIALAVVGLLVFNGAVFAWPACLDALAVILLVMAAWLFQPHGAPPVLSCLPLAGAAAIALWFHDGRDFALTLSMPQAVLAGVTAIWLLVRLAVDAVRASPRLAQSAWLCAAGFAGGALLAAPELPTPAGMAAWGLWLAGFSALWCRDAQARAQTRVWLLSLR